MKLFIYKVYQKIKENILSPLKYAKFIGVCIGNNTIIMTKYFGSEPYLITIGNNSEIYTGVRFIAHVGAVWGIRNIYDK